MSPLVISWNTTSAICCFQVTIIVQKKAKRVEPEVWTSLPATTHICRVAPLPTELSVLHIQAGCKCSIGTEYYVTEKDKKVEVSKKRLNLIPYVFWKNESVIPVRGGAPPYEIDPKNQIICFKQACLNFYRVPCCGIRRP